MPFGNQNEFADYSRALEAFFVRSRADLFVAMLSVALETQLCFRSLSWILLDEKERANSVEEAFIFVSSERGRSISQTADPAKPDLIFSFEPG